MLPYLLEVAFTASTAHIFPHHNPFNLGEKIATGKVGKIGELGNDTRARGVKGRRPHRDLTGRSQQKSGASLAHPHASDSTPPPLIPKEKKKI